MGDTDTTTDESGTEDGAGRVATDGGTPTVDEQLPATGDAHDADHDDHGHDFPPMGDIKRWFITTNHKDIGILYLATSIFFFLFGGLMALLIRTQMWVPRGVGEGILTAAAYNQAVSAHGLIMVFWFLSPFAFGFANYIIPLQIGAKDLAFPRLNALSYWLYLFSGVLFGISFFAPGGTFAGGWTMYAPLSVPTFQPNIGSSTAILALTLFVVSVTVSSVNFLTTMHRMRAEELTLRNLPMFTWAILLTTWMMLFAFAALLAGLMVLSADRILGTGYFTAEGGALLWDHVWWFFGHPEVYIVFFPALGVMAETFQTFTGRRLVGRKWFIAAMVLVAIQSFVVWMHHMFLTAINLEVKTLFMATTIGISLPFDLMMFSLIYTTIKGRVRFTTPFLFNFGAVLLFIIGGITGVFLGAVVLDYEFRGTYWVVAHFHYVMLGGGVALIGGLYYWFPKITGKMYDEFLGKLHFAVSFIGFNLIYFPQFIAWETPRRVFQYPDSFAIWHQLSTVGAYLFGLGFLLMFWNFYKSYLSGPDAGDNPWKYATTAEWAIPSPPPLENFPGLPSYKGGSLSFLSPTASGTGEGAEGVTDGGVAHAGAAAAATGTAHETEEHADHASIWPFVLGVGAFFLFLGLSGFTFDPPQGWDGLVYVPGGTEGLLYQASALLGLGIFSFGLLGMGVEPFTAHEGGFGEAWPFDGVENMKTGMWIFLASDVILFGAFIGSYVFLRVAEGWTTWHHLIPADHVVLPGLINTYILLTSSFTVVLALVASEKRNRPALIASLVATFVLGVGFLANKAVEWLHLFHIHTEAFPAGWDIQTNVASSTFYLTTGLHGLHVIIGLIVTGWLIYRAWGGAYLGEKAGRPVEYFGLYWHFVDIVWLFLFPLFYIL